MSMDNYDYGDAIEDHLGKCCGCDDYGVMNFTYGMPLCDDCIRQVEDQIKGRRVDKQNIRVNRRKQNEKLINTRRHQ